MGRTFSFSRSASATSARSNLIPAGASGDDEVATPSGRSSIVSSAAATPRSEADGAGSELSFYNPLRAVEIALQSKLQAAGVERAALEAANADLQAQLDAARAELGDARSLSNQLSSRASVAEDSRSATSQVRAAEECRCGGKPACGCCAGMSWVLHASAGCWPIVPPMLNQALPAFPAGRRRC